MRSTVEDRSPVLLCVDDDPGVLRLLADYFTLRGYVVLTARSGVEAFLQVARWAPRAIILDLFIPRLGGPEVLERIRRLDPGIVVILISGVPNALEMLAEAGVSAAGAFTKPVVLDRVAEALARAGVTPPAAVPADVAAQVRPPRRVRALAVDDEPEVRNLLTDYLVENGFEALGVWDGEEALRRIPEFRPHLILLDILMPGLSGVETLRRIKALLPETCVIMISAHDDVETAQRTLRMGAADYLRKPIDLRNLDSVLGIRPPAT